MEAMARWTDDRMDDLKHQVDELGRRMEQGFAEQRREFNACFDRLEGRLDERFEKVDQRFEKVDERFNRTQEMIIGLHATITRLSLTLLAVVTGLVVTRLA